MNNRLVWVSAVAISVVLIVSGSMLYFNAGDKEPWDAPDNWRENFEPTITKSEWIVMSQENVSDEIIMLDGNLTVTEGAKLNLSNTTIVVNGTWVVFEYDSEFPVPSNLIINGTLNMFNSRITCNDRAFKWMNYEEERTANVFYSLDFKNGAGILESSVIEGAWYFQAGDINVYNSTIRYCSIECGRSSPVFRNNIFEYNKNGIQISGYCEGVFEENIIRYNTGGGFNIQDSGNEKHRYPIIRNNTIEWNEYKGITCGDSSIIIQGNVIENNNVGISCYGQSGYYSCSPYIIDNLVSDNNEYGIEIHSAAPYITGNSICNNTDAGIHIAEHGWNEISDYKIWNNYLNNNGNMDNWTPLNYTPMLNLSAR